MAAMRAAGIFPPPRPWPRVELSAVFRVERFGDVDNRIATLKPVLDALVCGGWFAGDDPDRLTFAELPRQERVKRGDTCLIVTARLATEPAPVT